MLNGLMEDERVILFPFLSIETLVETDSCVLCHGNYYIEPGLGKS